jgi:hypothetical protein
MILKKLNLIILALGLVFMVSCKDEEKQAEDYNSAGYRSRHNYK